MLGLKLNRVSKRGHWWIHSYDLGYVRSTLLWGCVSIIIKTFSQLIWWFFLIVFLKNLHPLSWKYLFFFILFSETPFLISIFNDYITPSYALSSSIFCMFIYIYIYIYIYILYLHICVCACMPEPGAKVNWQWGQVGWMLADHRDGLSSSSL